MKPTMLLLLVLVWLVVPAKAQNETAPQQKLSNNDRSSWGKKLFFRVEAEQEQYRNLAEFRLACLSMGYRINGNLNLSGGVLALKQFTYNQPWAIDRIGLRFDLNYSITKQLDFNLWGQYITSSPIDSPSDFLLPQTGTGTSVTLNLGGRSQLGVGAAYLYDNRKERWDYQSGGKLKLFF